jgi:hypothetical protein
VRRILTLVALLWPVFAHAQTPMIPTMNGFHLTSPPLNAADLNGANRPVTINLGPVTGTYPAGGTPSSMDISCYGDTANATGTGVAPACLTVNMTSSAGGAMGVRETMRLSNFLTGPGVSPAGFLLPLEMRATADAPMDGSAYPTKAAGQVDGMSVYAIGTGKDGWLIAINGLGEINWEQIYGGAAVITNAGQFARLSTDWGTVAAAPGDVNTLAGRYGLWIDSQQPLPDTSSTAAMTASTGKNLPGFRAQFLFGGGEQESTFDPNVGSIMYSFPQIYENKNGCTSGVSNCTATVIAGKVKPQELWDGLQFGNIHFNNEVVRSPGFVVKGTGEVDLGSVTMTPTTSGMTIDTAGSYITAATFNGGDITNRWQVGEYMYGSYGAGTVPGAILRVTQVNGAATPGVFGTPTQLAIVDRGWSKATAATNNASAALGTAATFMGHGRSIIQLTWTDVAGGGSLFVQAPLKLVANTIALLPTCNAGMQNSMAVATDVTTATYNAPAVGGGSNRLPVFCDGSAWRAH